MEFYEFLRQYGPLAGVALFFIWRDWQRELRLSTRIEYLESEHREVIIPLVKQSTEVIARNTEVIERFEMRLENRGN